MPAYRFIQIVSILQRFNKCSLSLADNLRCLYLRQLDVIISFILYFYFLLFLKDEIVILTCPPVGQTHLGIILDENSECVYNFSVTVNPSVSTKEVGTRSQSSYIETIT